MSEFRSATTEFLVVDLTWDEALWFLGLAIAEAAVFEVFSHCLWLFWAQVGALRFMPCGRCGHPLGWHFRGVGSCLECSCLGVPD